jgi:F0F1-type ATP synthase assembly protein I
MAQAMPLAFCPQGTIEAMADRDDRSFWLQVARYSQLALVLPAATVVGLVIGWALAKWLHREWLEIVGLLLGIAAGFVELVRTVTGSEEKNQ